MFLHVSMWKCDLHGVLLDADRDVSALDIIHRHIDPLVVVWFGQAVENEVDRESD